MSASGGRLPYPGLRSFTREETDLFFGREGSVDQMVDRLAATRFLAVLGASGSGKSSLVRTGLLDALELGVLHKAGSRWMIADFRPGRRPIHNLAEGLLRAANPASQPNEDDTRLLSAFLARGPRSVIEWCKADNLPPGTNLLLLVDQFEELFRYSAYAEREDAEAFVSLLLESARAALSEARIYVCITMRSEHLAAAALIDGLAEAVNAGLYLTPRMSRDQVREAIVGPAAVCGFSIEPALVNRILNDLSSFAPWEEEDTGRQLERLVRGADQLPLMQHVLNRLWSIAEERSAGDSVELTLADYEALGGLRGALAAHGREILEELLPEHRGAASAVFSALSSGSSLAEATRRPTEFRELVQIAGGDEIAVREIVEAFRAPGRNFLVPARPMPLRAKTVIDISHESLIRQWDQFGRWLQREIRSAETWRRLVDAAERYARGQANLLSGLTLASIANWWDTERPAAAWAKRYGGDFSQVTDFLADSRRAEEESRQAEAEERRKKTRNRLVTAAVAAFLCIVTPLAAFAGYMAWSASREALRANQATDAADKARSDAESQRQAAETERQRADEERVRALAAQREAGQQAAAAEAERKRADDERQRALAAQQDAAQQAAAAEAERKRADDERRRALAAQEEAAQQAAAAEAERKRADDERQRAIAAQQNAAQQAAAAEAERKRADDERQRALAAQEEAAQQAIAAESERKRADEERRRALAAQENAIQQVAAAEEQRKRADDERERALAAQQEAVQAAALAQTESARADQERQRAEHARAALQRSNLQQLADRVTALQSEGSWDAAANILGTLWERLGAPDKGLRQNWLIEPIVAAFARQSMAEYPVFPDFLAYSGFSGRTGASGRFRIYALTRKGPDGEAIADRNKVMAVFDGATGAVLGSFELPGGSPSGNAINLVSPDGGRVAIITGEGEIAVWANGQGAPTIVSIPHGAGKTVISQLAPVSTDARFALYLALDENPDEIIVIDPATSSITFRVGAADIATGVGVPAVKTIKLLGLVDGRILLLVNDSGGSVVAVDASNGSIRRLETGAGVTGAQITPDGAILLTLTCPGSCSEQHLTAYDLRRETPLWVERVPLGMMLSEPAVAELTVAGVPTFSALVEQEGAGIVFEMPKARPHVVTRYEGGTHPRIGLITLDGTGGYRAVEPAKEVLSSDGLPAAAMLANYRRPLARNKLSPYVGPNSVAVYQSEDGARIGGVTGSGDLPSTRDAADNARLVAMRSTLDEEVDASLDSLTRDLETEASLSASAKPSAPDCVAEMLLQIARLESRLLGDGSAGAVQSLPAECSTSVANSSSEAAEALARRGAGASVGELVGDGAFSRVLQGAAAGDQTAGRVLGAALARIAVDRGELDRSTIARDAMRFGADLPAFVLPGIAAGGPIDPELLKQARARKGTDPAAHQLIAHFEERRINDLDALASALIEYSIAERLYRATGQKKDAAFCAHRRVQLARLLPDDRVLQIAAAIDAWKPETPDIAPTGPLSDLPTDAVERRALDARNAEALAERLPGSPLLEALRAELDHAS